MSSIVQNLLERATENLSSHDWTADLVERGRGQLHSLEPGVARDAGKRVLDVLEKRSDDVREITAAGFASVATRLALGQDDEARLDWLEHRATPEERMSALDDAISATINRKKSDDEAWGRIKDVALQVLKVGGQIAVPLLLAAL